MIVLTGQDKNAERVFRTVGKYHGKMSFPCFVWSVVDALARMFPQLFSCSSLVGLRFPLPDKYGASEVPLPRILYSLVRTIRVYVDLP